MSTVVIAVIVMMPLDHRQIPPIRIQIRRQIIIDLISFANDFDGNNGSSGQNIVSVEDVSPTMQQYQLQLKLLQQQHQERRAYQQNQPQNQPVQVQSQPGQQATTLSTNTLSLPPPPYYP
ncbi:hypothetical protein EDC96DRAFT_549942 [Choanephora cucurbitarum]|nr:hypothetical protein EDC96DRAFT_549942 [Choanephora cucurbitarum]